MKICERSSLSDTRVSERGRGVRVETPLQPLVKTLVRKGVPRQPTEILGEEEIHLKPEKDSMPEQMDA